MNQPIRIDSDVRVPRPKYVVKAEQEQQRLFRAYKRAYMSCYVREPKLISVTATGFFVIDTMQAACNAKRLKQVTEMLRSRAKETA